MPRPARKPKRFNPSKEQNDSVAVHPVASTPVHSKDSTTGFPASPGFSPIKPRSEIPIYEDPDPPSDEFGFSKVKGSKNAISINNTGSTINEEESSIVDDHFNDDDSCRKQPLAKRNEIPTAPKADSSSPTPLPASKHKKPIRRFRTSELLPLLPARRKRPTRVIQKEMPIINTSDENSDGEVVHSKGRKQIRTLEKENDSIERAELDSEEEAEMNNRREMIKKKFAAVDKWDLVFENVDVSFSSQ